MNETSRKSQLGKNNCWNETSTEMTKKNNRQRVFLHILRQCYETQFAHAFGIVSLITQHPLF